MTRIELTNRILYATPTGFKASHRSKVSSPLEIARQLTKSERRRLRKKLRLLGRIDLILRTLAS